MTIDVKSAALLRGVTLKYVEYGNPDGSPLLLLHGLGDSWRSFLPVLPHLPRSIRSIAVTQRGHGDSRTIGLVLEGGFASTPTNQQVKGLWDSVVSTMTDPVDPDFVRDFQQGATAKPIPQPFFETLWGDQDATCPRFDQDQLTTSIHGSRLIVYPGVGHTPTGRCRNALRPTLRPSSEPLRYVDARSSPVH